MVKNIFLAEDTAVFHRHFSSDPIAVASVIEALTDQYQVFHLPVGAVSNIEIVLSEVINNINEYAYSGADNGPIEILAEKKASKVAFELVDCGTELPGGALPLGTQQVVKCDIEDLPEGGFGWSLIRQLSSDLEYIRRDGENHLSFVVTIDGSSPTNCLFPTLIFPGY